MKELLKKFFSLLFAVPFVIGTIGYLLAGERITDAFYGSIALYLVSPISDAYNGWIEVARWLAAFVTATAVLSLLKEVGQNMKWKIDCWSKNSVAVYSDKDIDILFDKEIKAIYPGERFEQNAKSQMILFSSDKQSLEFYEKYKKRWKENIVNIGFREFDVGLLNIPENVRVFDINGAIARSLWKKIRLWENGQKAMDIVIYGNSILTEKIISYGLQMNLFSKDQRITYHIFSEELCFQEKHPNLELQNNDTLVFYENVSHDMWQIVKNADIAILADEVSIQMLELFAVNLPEKKVYYYSPEAGDAGSYIAYGQLEAFGRNVDIFTDENIRRQKLEQSAMELNMTYAEQYGGEADWNKLSCFTRSSNISTADYMEVVKELLGHVPEEELANLEHICWCRFHFLNYWRAGSLENGKSKDTEKRIHKDLVLYEQLSDEEKEKDRDIIRLVKQKMD